MRTIRPAEADQALRFYRDSLNRMTMSDLRAALDEARLDVLAIVPWFDRAVVPYITSDVVAEVSRAYPGAITEDLIATFVTVIARRPS